MVKVSKNTTVNKIEPISDKYAIMFAPELIKIILSGEKVETYRYGNKYDYLQIGDRIKIQNSITKKIIASAKILNKTVTSFKNLPLAASGHETCSNKEEQRKVLSGYYAYIGREIRDNDSFLVFEFQVC